jgi:hypothetical protein
LYIIVFLNICEKNQGSAWNSKQNVLFLKTH